MHPPRASLSFVRSPPESHCVREGGRPGVGCSVFSPRGASKFAVSFESAPSRPLVSAAPSKRLLFIEAKRRDRPRLFACRREPPRKRLKLAPQRGEDGAFAAPHAALRLHRGKLALRALVGVLRRGASKVAVSFARASPSQNLLPNPKAPNAGHIPSNRRQVCPPPKTAGRDSGGRRRTIVRPRGVRGSRGARGEKKI